MYKKGFTSALVIPQGFCAGYSAGQRGFTLLELLVVVLIIGIFGVFLSAKTVVPTLQRTSTPRAAASKGNRATGASRTASAATSAEDDKSAPSPLDDPFAVRYPYPGTGVSANVVALDMTTKEGFNICGGFRYQERWIATAAHCLEPFGTQTNPRVVVGAEQLPNGVWRVSLSEPTNDTPANATIYFYRKGYSSARDNIYGHAEDIALIGLDKNDKMISFITQQVKKLDEMSAQLPLPEVTAQARRQMTRALNDKKKFLQQPLDKYRFMTFSPESARAELAGRVSDAYYFAPASTTPNTTARKLPQVFQHTYVQVPQNNDHIIQWRGIEIKGMSGTPLIIRGFVVGFGSGGGATSLLTDDFTAFLKRSMGKEYKKICVRAVANQEAVTQRTQP